MAPLSKALLPLLSCVAFQACAGGPPLADQDGEAIKNQHYKGVLQSAGSTVFITEDNKDYELRLMGPSAQAQLAAIGRNHEPYAEFCVDIDLMGRENGKKNDVGRPILLVFDITTIVEIDCSKLPKRD